MTIWTGDMRDWLHRRIEAAGDKGVHGNVFLREMPARQDAMLTEIGEDYLVVRHRDGANTIVALRDVAAVELFPDR